MVKLTDQLLQENSKRSQVFVPADFALSLKKAIDTLQSHMVEADRRIEASCAKAQRAEETHKACMRNHTMRLDSLLAQFHRIDTKISRVTHTAIRIGNTLETVDSQKRNNEEGKQLIRHFLSFNTGVEENLDPVFRNFESLESLQEAARLIQALQGVVGSLRVKGAQVAIDLIGRKAREIESALSQQFVSAQKSMRLEDMRRCAASLLHFNNKVIDTYVKSACESLEPHMEILSRQGVLTPREFLPLLAQFYSDIVATVEREVTMIGKVFAESLPVIFVLLVALARHVGSYVDLALTEGCRGQSMDVFLTSLDLAFSSTTKLVNQLAVGPLKPFGMDAYEAAEINFTEVFKNYRQNYPAQERNLLNELIGKDISRALAVEEAEEKLLAKIKRSQDEVFARFKDNVRTMLNVSVVESCVKYGTAALSRCQGLSIADELPEHAFLLVNAMFSMLVESYFRPVLLLAAEHQNDEEKGEPNTFHLELVGLVTAAQGKLRRFYAESVAPIVAKNPNTDAICDNAIHDLLASLENLLLAGLERTLEASMRYCNKLWASQKTTSYKPKDEKVLEENDPTNVSFGLVADYVEKVYRAALQGLEGLNLDRFLIVFATQLVQAIRTHLSKFQISTLGAALLAQDLKLIQEATRQFKIPAVDQLLERLLSETQMFFVVAEYLPALLLTPEFKKIDMDELASLVKLRADFSANKPKMLALFPSLA